MEEDTWRLHRIDVVFEGANEKLDINAYGKSPSYVNFYSGKVPDGVALQEYNRLVYKDLYQHIDLVYEFTGSSLHYEFIVHPGGNPRQIRLRYDGEEGMHLDQLGNLIVMTSIGDFHESTPYVYQPQLFGQNGITSRFELDGKTLAFHIDEYNTSQSLIIDPWVTFFGGNADDKCVGVTTDRKGRVYFAGETLSWDLPVSPGCFQDSARLGTEAFFAQFGQNGNRKYCTFIGGNGDDRANAIVVNATGEIYLTGATASTDFPLSASPYQNKNKGVDDAFLAKFDTSGARIWCTYYGGEGSERALSMAIDSSRNIIITGQTLSFKLPVSTTAWQKVAGGWDDGFVTKFNSIGKLVWATYYGGASGDRFTGVCVGEKDNLYFSGRTWSLNFPVTANAYQGTLSGTTNDEDAVVVKLDSSGKRIWGTYFGGGKEDVGNAITIDKKKNITIAGRAISTNFPVSAGAFQSTLLGGTDVFLASFDSGGVYRWSTYYGGASDDEALALCADTNGYVYVSGTTKSANFPVSALSAQGTNHGGQDAFLLRFDEDGNRQWGTYFGGSADDAGLGLSAIGTSIYLVGQTSSANFPVINPFQATKLYASDAFFAIFTEAGTVPVELSSFHVNRSAKGALIQWETATEINNYGFEIQRMDGHGSNWLPIAFVPGKGLGTQRQNYTYEDAFSSVHEVTRYYRLKQIDLNGEFAYSPVVEIDSDAMLRSLEFLDVFPSPSHSGATVAFYTALDGTLDIVLYNSAGQEVRKLSDRQLWLLGYHQLSFDVSAIPAGVYVVRIASATRSISQPVVVNR